MQPFKSLGSHGVVAQDFVNAFEKFLRPLFRVSNFDLSVPTFSVSTTNPKVLKQSEHGGAFDPSEAKFMPSSLNKASA